MARQRKRGIKGAGSVYQRKGDGRWVGSFKIEETGKRKYIYADSEIGAWEELRKAQQAQAQGTLATGPTQTLKVYLNTWLEQVHKSSIGPRTYIMYRGILDHHIIPVLGHIQLQKLTPQKVQAFYASKLEAGFGSSTISSFHTILHCALKNAVRWNLVSRNVCDQVKKPREVHYTIQPLTEIQAKRLQEVAQGDALEGLILVTLALGLRRGEVTGLKWQDIDYDAKCLYIRRSVGRIGTSGIKEMDPKTATSKRKIMLPPFLIEVFKRQWDIQQEMKKQQGAKWQDSGYIFCSQVGGFLHENSLYRLYKRLLKRAGLPNIRFHDLRHSAATLMINMGVNPKVVQEILGHSNIAMTMDIYTHVLPSMQQDAMEKLENLFKDDHT